MSTRICRLVFAALALGAASWAVADTSNGKDLQATIVLNGHPCDQVVNSKRNADSDYTATCKDGNRYRVFVDPKGRVVVQKL
ncbi:MAG TPA: hypothetical protein VGI90_07110 [Steroidobacteraceae bacterium]